MPRLGILGTMVWDRIHARDGRAEPLEEWGGISYALAATSAALPEGWTAVPLVKIGRDAAEQALEFLGRLPGMDLSRGVRRTDEANPCVELRYVDHERRTERLTGGLPSWSWPELEPLVGELDALYLNFISGHEMSLETAQRLRLGFRGPIYTDLHTLLLGFAAGGLRTPRLLERWREWLRCFDVVQVNEDELGLLARAWGGDPWRFAAEVVGHELRLLLVTLGDRGAAYVASPAYAPDPLGWHPDGIAPPPPLAVPGTTRSERVAAAVGPAAGDPTGCGDVWGATCWLALLSGAPVRAAMASANAAAARNVGYRGASGLHLHLRGRIQT